MQEHLTGYEVDYNERVIYVTNSTTLLTFTATSITGSVFSDTVVVMVTAISRYGIGSASDPVTVVITGKYIFNNDV